MPSQSVLEQKKAIVAELSERLKNSITGLVVEYKGINTEDDTKLRKRRSRSGGFEARFGGHHRSCHQR